MSKIDTSIKQTKIQPKLKQEKTNTFSENIKFQKVIRISMISFILF